MNINIDKFIEEVQNEKGGNLNIRCKGMMLSVIRGMDKNKSEFTRDCVSANPETLIALDRFKKELEVRSKDLCLKFAKGEIDHKALIPTLEALDIVYEEFMKCARACKENFDRIDELRRMNVITK